MTFPVSTLNGRPITALYVAALLAGCANEPATRRYGSMKDEHFAASAASPARPHVLKSPAASIELPHDAVAGWSTKAVAARAPRNANKLPVVALSQVLVARQHQLTAEADLQGMVSKPTASGRPAAIESTDRLDLPGSSITIAPLEERPSTSIRRAPRSFEPSTQMQFDPVLRQAPPTATPGQSNDKKSSKTASLSHSPGPAAGMPPAPPAPSGPQAAPAPSVKATSPSAHASASVATPFATSVTASSGPGETSEVAMTIERSELLLRIGNVFGARDVLEPAVSAGSALAITALAKTYDPHELRAFMVPPGTADVSKASALYGDAIRLGAFDARHRLERLKQAASQTTPVSQSTEPKR